MSPTPISSNRMVKPILIVQGGQYGSEAKGAIAGYLCKKESVNYAVRTGATNAGHTVYFDSTAVKMQQLPVGWVNRDTQLVVGAGALIDPEILRREVAEIQRLTGEDVRDRLFVDRRAGVHLPHHAFRSKESNRHYAIGATGKGCSEALIDRIRGRGNGYQLFGDTAYSREYDVCDTETLLNHAWNEGALLLLEGTQGQMLDLYTGPYPYTTHKQTGPAQWMLEAGLSPALPVEIAMVVRTYPIRVAGNSGPLPSETSWPEVAREVCASMMDRGMDPLIQESSIIAFENAIREAARGSDLQLPDGSDGNDQHLWREADRVTFQKALSELNTRAWKLLDPATQSDLLQLFEMTTVTKKLRRIAHLDLGTLSVSARQCRPTWVAVTFMNYRFPWNRQSDEHPDVTKYLGAIEAACRAPVRILTYGPTDAQVVDRKA